MLFNNNSPFFLEETDQNKLFLIWLSHNNPEELKKHENELLMQKTWHSIKNGLQTYFCDYKISLDTIINSFKNTTLTTDPKIAFQYRPASNKFISNIATLFFSLVFFRNKGYVSTIFWKLGGSLIHEFKHYQIFKENNLIGKENEIEEFGKIQGIRIEKSANLGQIGFLENCKKNLPISTLEYLIRIASWSVDGTPIIDKTSLCNQVQKIVAIKEINREISNIKTDINVQALTKYQETSKSKNISLNRNIMDTLSLPYTITDEKNTYPEIKLML